MFIFIPIVDIEKEAIHLDGGDLSANLLECVSKTSNDFRFASSRWPSQRKENGRASGSNDFL